MDEITLRERLIVDIGAIRAENAKTRLWDSDERIADYLLSRGWTLPSCCGAGGDPTKAEEKVNSAIEPKYSIVLSQKFVRKGSNHNVLVIGSAGTGKTRCYVLPNLLQCNGSYVVADLAGVLQEKTEQIFRKNGYDIKTFDVKEASATDIEAFDAADIGNKPTIVYVSLSFNSDNNARVMLPLVQKIMNALSPSAEIPVHFFLDEFCNIGEIPYLQELLAGSNLNLSCSIIIQSISQLQTLYKETWQDIVQCCDTTLYFGGGIDWRTCEYLSGLMSQNAAAEAGKEKHHNTMSPDEIRKMPYRNCLILVPGRDPIIDQIYDPISHPNYTP